MKSLIALKSVAISLLLMISHHSIADSISGNLVFDKKPPFTGIVFIANSGSTAKSPKIDQKDKDFTTSIAVGSPKEKIAFINSDTFDHNIYANDTEQNVKFDVGLMTPNNDTQIAIDWPAPTLVRVGCKIHPKMRSYIANINSDHYQAFDFSKTESSYDVSIKDIPGDKHQVILLMPAYDDLTIDLKKGETKTVELLRKGKAKGSLTLTRS